MGTITATGWKNKGGTGGRSCNCKSWKNHWINGAKKAWPSTCSVAGCNGTASLGGHIINKEVSGEYIVPLCDSCNKVAGTFNLKGDITLIPANKAETCEK